MLDKFLQEVYTTPNLTLEQVNRIYHDVSERYGQWMFDDTYCYSWISVSHDFYAPFYYLSYATSALASLELLARSVEDYDAALYVYLRLTSRGVPAQNGFRAALKLVGLDDVFAEESGILHGRANGTLAPAVPITHAEAATLLANYLT